MRKYKYEEMLPLEFQEAVAEKPVFFVPTGLLEWHGNHLPLGLDGLKAYEICCRLAERIDGGIVLPVNYLGRPGFSSYLGTLTYSESLVNGYFYELFGQLKKVGAKVIVVLTGHYGQLQVECLARVADCFMSENPEIKVIAQPEYDGVVIDGEIPADHAAKWETSIFWSMKPELTYIENLSELPTGQKTYQNPPNDHYKESAVWEFCNNVQDASPELGTRTVNAIVDCFAAKIESALNDAAL